MRFEACESTQEIQLGKQELNNLVHHKTIVDCNSHFEIPNHQQTESMRMKTT